MMVAIAVSVLTINIGYVAERSCQRLREFQFVSRLLGGNYFALGESGNRFSTTAFGELTVPLPANFVLGIDVQQRDFEYPRLPNYLFSVSRSEGWYSYYLWGLLLKTPIAFCLMLILRIGTWGWGRKGKWSLVDEMLLVFPTVSILLVASLKTGMNQHVRYVLPCLPFVCVWVSGVFSTPPMAGKHQRLRIRRSIAVGLLGLYCLTSLSVYPHSLGFFNVLSGGPKGGPDSLLGSNVDWGQDLIWLENWRAKNPESARDRTYLAFEGQYNPFDLLGTDFRAWRLTDSGSIDLNASYAIGANVLFEMPVSILGDEGTFIEIDSRPLSALREMEPIGWAGYSIRIYSASQMQQAYREAKQEITKEDENAEARKTQRRRVTR